jgi:hypothetical protein
MSIYLRAIQAAALPLGSALLLASATPATAASGFDGSRDLLCAPSDVAECDSRGNCERVSPSDVALPHFLQLQFSKKRLVSEEVAGRSTQIDNVRSVDGLTILQGIDNGRAWSVAIHQETGRLSGSVVDSEGAFLVFGACRLP